jgi:hypothetical protein
MLFQTRTSTSFTDNLLVTLEAEDASIVREDLQYGSTSDQCNDDGYTKSDKVMRFFA